MIATLAVYRYLAYFLAIIATGGAIYLAIENHDTAQQQIGYDRAAAECRAAKTQADAAALAQERSMQKALQDAQNAATERQNKLRTDYAAAHTAALGLRRTVADLRDQLASAPAAACRATADTALVVFDDCAEKYRAVAEAADGHASDVKTLTDGWPR